MDAQLRDALNLLIVNHGDAASWHTKVQEIGRILIRAKSELQPEAIDEVVHRHMRLRRKKVSTERFWYTVTQVGSGQLSFFDPIDRIWLSTAEKICADLVVLMENQAAAKE